MGGVRYLMGEPDRKPSRAGISLGDTLAGTFATMGALAAAQFFNSAVKSNAEIPGAIGRGDFKPLYDWLGENIHRKGSYLETPDLIAGATGAPLDPEFFISHLQSRYLG